MRESGSTPFATRSFLRETNSPQLPGHDDAGGHQVGLRYHRRDALCARPRKGHRTDEQNNSKWGSRCDERTPTNEQLVSETPRKPSGKITTRARAHLPAMVLVFSPPKNASMTPELRRRTTLPACQPCEHGFEGLLAKMSIIVNQAPIT